MKRQVKNWLNSFADEEWRSDLDVFLTKDLSLGDLYLPVAMKLAKKRKENPLKIAEEIASSIRKNIDNNSKIDKVEVKAPGFINLFFSSAALSDLILSLASRIDVFSNFLLDEEKKNILLEFVSANPTGPLSVAHARQAAVGDSLARILRFAGHNVLTEYYLNDVGRQIELLGESVKERCKEVLGGMCAIPEGGYKGGYVKELAAKFLSLWREKMESVDNLDVNELARFAVGEILSMIRRDLKRFGVDFDNWFSQYVMEKEGRVEWVISLLKDKGFLYEKDGALWFASSKFGDDKDRVVVKSDGSLTYFAADIAYHHIKFSRGYDLVINLWGPDHHGYIPRLKATVEALGFCPDNLKVIIVQLVSLFRAGKQIPMSTRQGEYVTMEELMDDVGVDAARFFLLMRKTSSHLDFDIDLAKKHAPENPVYYLQYAHARATRIEEVALENGLNFDLSKEQLLQYLSSDSLTDAERSLIRTMARFEAAIENCLFDLDPYPLVEYLREIATLFHKFYETSRVVGEDTHIAKSRLMIVRAVKNLIKKGASLLGVSCPDRM